ncbi:MAG: DMT family transporter [Planctomycetota bacterium]
MTTPTQGPAAPPPRAGAAVAALVAVQILFGVHYGVAKEIMEVIPAAAWALVRCVGAATILALLVVVTRRRWPRSLADWSILAVLSVFGVTLNQILFIEGLYRSTTLHSVVVMASIPLQTLLFSALLRQERLTVAKLSGVVVGGIGIAYLLFGQAESRADDVATTTAAQPFWDSIAGGDLLMTLNAGSFSLFLALSKRPARTMDPLVMTAVCFAIGAIPIVFYGYSSFVAVTWSDVPIATYGFATFAILGATVGTYLLNFYALKRVSASLVGIFVYLQFIIAGIVGVTWRQESFSWRLVVAGILVISGLQLRLLHRDRIARTAQAEAERAS